jgi:hypothetical protein
MNRFVLGLRASRHLKYGAPFFLFLLGGTYALREFRSVRYDAELNPKAKHFGEWTAYLPAQDELNSRGRHVISKCNGVTSYRLCHVVLRAITFSGDNGSNFDRAINLRRNNSS